MRHVLKRWRATQATALSVALKAAVVSAIVLIVASGAIAGDGIMLKVTDVTLKDVVTLLMQQSGANMVIADSSMLEKKITANLSDVSLEKALNHIVKSAGIAFKKMDDGTYIIVYLQDGANALETAASVRAMLEESAKAFPEGMRYEIPFDTTRFVEVSIEGVVHTLIEAIILVLVVVYIFLQNFRATLVPLLAVPVAVVGTFAGLLLLGFSINVLTLFLLFVLAMIAFVFLQVALEMAVS